MDNDKSKLKAAMLSAISNELDSCLAKESNISAKLQKIMCLLSQGPVFEESEELLRELTGVEISAKQF